jgi:N-acetylglutamate synthase-like GNAT family acetyltransferase
MQVQLVSAASADIERVQRLLTSAELALAGLYSQFPGAYVVARQAGELVGVAGLERHGNVGLLRSVAVATEQRSTGLGRLLVRDRLARANEAGLSAVYLLTTTAREYFARLDFTAADRAAVPERLAASEEFAHACPAAAACLVWRPRP